MAKLFDLPRYIAVEGPIRVGKSTLSKILAERLNAQRVTDPEHNSFLRPFYQGEPGAAFQAQFTFLVQRFEQLRDLDLGARSQKLVVSDFIFEKDKLFAYLNLNDQELDTYNRYYNYFRDQLPTPDLVIYLQATPEVLKKRLKKKNAAGEKAISEEYLEEVVKAYEHFFFHYTSSDLLIVNTSEIDFVERSRWGAIAGLPTLISGPRERKSAARSAEKKRPAAAGNRDRVQRRQIRTSAPRCH